MKKLISLFAMLLMGAAVMVSCNDDDDNNGGGGTSLRGLASASRPIRWSATAGPTSTSTPTTARAA